MDTTLACFRGYADCVEGAKEMGVIYGTGVYEKGAIIGRETMKQAYELVHMEEIKAAAAPGTEAMANFSALKTLTDYEVGTGAVICSTDRPYPLGEDVIAISPWEI